MKRNTARMALLALLMTFMVAMGIGKAEAHTPGGGADCTGYFVKATSYEAANNNYISSTFDGVTTTRKFATNDQITGSWPQDGVAHTWSGFVHTNNTNTAYSKDYGPITLTCGPPPPMTAHEYRNSSTVPTCKNPTVTTTFEQRDETFVWDGTQYVGTWSDWYITSQTTKTVHVGNCTVIRHAHVRVSVVDKCSCFRDKVTLNHGPNVRSHLIHPNKHTWKFVVTGKKVGNKQYMLPSHIRGSHGWAITQTYVIHTTNVPCPCEKTHTCHKPRHPHPHCKTSACKIN